MQWYLVDTENNFEIKHLVSLEEQSSIYLPEM